MNKKNHLHKIVLIFVATLLGGSGLTFCKNRVPRNISPKDTIRNLNAVIKTEDVSSFITCYDQLTRNKLQKQKQDIKKFWPTYCKVMSRGNIEDVKQEIIGDRAIVVVTYADDDVKRQYELRREGKNWVVLSPHPLVTVDFLTYELERKGKIIAQRSEKPASPTSSVPMEMIRKEALFANEYPNLFNAVKLFRNLDPNLLEPHKFISGDKSKDNIDPNFLSLKHSSTLKVPAGRIAESNLEFWTSGGRVTAKLITEKEGIYSFVNVPDGFRIYLLSIDSSLVFPNKCEVNYLVEIAGWLKPSIYDIDFFLKMNGAWDRHICLKVNVTKAQTLETLEQLASSYWKLFYVFAQMNNLSRLTAERITSLGLDMGLQDFKSKMAMFQKDIICIKCYCNSALYAKNYDIRMAAEMFRHLQYPMYKKDVELQKK